MSDLSGDAASVRVGIATHNRAPDLVKAIASVRAQSYRPLSISVLDDASTDDTPSLRGRHPSVTWERWERSQGCREARNHLMLQADESYYVSLDDDAWFLAGDEVAVAIAFLERNPKAAAVAFDILSAEDPHIRPRGGAQQVALFIGCGHVLRLSAVKKLGGYAEVPGAYGGEEKDLCLRLVEAGHQIVMLDGVHVWHDKSATARDVGQQHRSGVCNDLVFELRRCPPGLLAVILPWKLLRHIVFAVRHDLLSACWRGIAQFAHSAGPAWRSRRPVGLWSYVEFLRLIRWPRPIMAVD